ncbi:hypothetical protein B0H14DRAFT_3554064 [Mycena olivaceomarginata]|nr:hypothetical protein B0H14DRAFT_3554064 [Mycena olivaceomarginata]
MCAARGWPLHSHPAIGPMTGPPSGPPSHAMPLPHGYHMVFSLLCSSPHPSAAIDMPKASKAGRARQNNLQKARKATVEDVPDEDDIRQTSENNTKHDFHDHFHSELDDDDNWDFNLGNELPDLDCEDISEQELDLDEEIIVAPEITDKTELEAFSQRLHNAQETAQKAE